MSSLSLSVLAAELRARATNRGALAAGARELSGGSAGSALSSGFAGSAELCGTLATTSAAPVLSDGRGELWRSAKATPAMPSTIAAAIAARPAKGAR